ncbi:hypothetical protein Tco_0960659 [Tanacetum coccineum]
MSSSAPTNTETISSASGARGSLVPTSFHDDSYMLVKQAYSPIAMDTKSEPPSPDYTPSTPHTNKELEPLDTSKIRVTSSPSTTPPTNLTTLPSSQQPPLTQTLPTPTPPRLFYYRGTARMAVHTHPTLSPGLSDRLTKAMALSPSSFHNRYISSYETQSSSSSSSLTLPSRKRYRGTSKLIADIETKSDESKEEGIDSESEEVASEDQ